MHLSLPLPASPRSLPGDLTLLLHGELLSAGRPAFPATEPTQRDGIRIGDPVRIIRDPLFGVIGEVSRLPSELQTIPTESEVRVLEVQFGDGHTAVIPRANIEVIEGA